MDAELQSMPRGEAMNKLWPSTARTAADDEFWLGGCAASALADEFGTPLYVFDEETLRAQARTYREALTRHYPGTTQAAYASKAYLCTAIAQLFAEEGLDLDIVSGGELYVARQAGFPPERIHFHGNNKSREELTEALTAGIGRIVVDNYHELAMLAELIGGERPVSTPAAQAVKLPVRVWLRLSPGVAAHTHTHIQTGHLDTKFGFPIATGDAERAVVRAMQTPGLELVGLHCHIGSQIYEPESLADAAAVLIAFAAEMRDRRGFTLRELSPGGGWGVPMIEDDPAAPLEPYIAALTAAVVEACRARDLVLPHLVLEPGRSLVAQAAVAVYTIGARKEIPGVRTYVSVDGGMADNIRPALYGAKYAARRIANQQIGESTHRAVGSSAESPSGILHEIVTIAGKYCESGDILIRDIELPRLETGDLLAIPMAGAYTLAMASNYNLARRPAVVLVRDGSARLIQRRETYADLVARDLPLHADRP
jgi:diaminopimelate decarboxylase